MIIDAPQREQALDPTRSFIVEAPAGSGKTGLLVQRFLRLLSIVEKPESVVAITFTRKAAAEMKRRVLESLTAAAEPSSDQFTQKTRTLAAAVMKQSQQKSWNLLADPSRLQIQTIDSLSALLTRQMPILSEFGGFGEVVEEASELYLRAARAMLTNLAEGTEEEKALFRRMVLHFDNEISMLETQVVKMLSKRDQWEHLNPVSDAQLVNDCCVLLAKAELQLRSVFQRSGKVDFTEIARAARRALGKPEQPSDLLYSLDYRFQHLLVDEFQDTSRSQFNLVTALTEQWSLGDDHTLFLVGDPMQSIYRFREADVSLFLDCWETKQIGAVPLTALSLQTNFRTTANILNWVGTNFEPKMPADDKPLAAVKFRKSFSGRDQLGPAPQVIAYINDNWGREEADEIVRIIKRNPEQSIAILVRSRNQTTQILPALRKAGITYEAIEIESLKEQQHIIDLLSLTRALTNLADRVSWLACLRAPWCGLTLADLSTLAEGNKQTILTLLSDPKIIQSLTVDGRYRAVSAQEILSSAVSQVGRLPLRQLVEQTWQQLGGLAIVSEPNQREDIQTLLCLIADSEEGGVIRDFSLLNRRLESLYARAPASDCNVSIMTVYQAKGLEFDIVILPQIGKMVRQPENELLIWTESQAQGDANPELQIAAMPQSREKDAEYTRIKKLLEEKEKNEITRLFYVACTRAKDHLYLIGSTKTKKDGTPQAPRTGTFLKIIWESVQEEFAGIARRQITAPITNIDPASRSLLSRLPLSWREPVLAKSVQTAPLIRRAVASQRQVSYRWVGDTIRHAGTIVHEMLKNIAAEGTANWTEARVLTMRSFVNSELLRLGVPTTDAAAATKQVIRAVTNTITSPRGQWILSPHANARSEWAIAGRTPQGLVSGTVDRAFLDETGNYWIIDYKNSEHTGSGISTFLANEKFRYQPQLEQYATVISRMVNAPINMGLYFPLHDAWVEWKLAEAAVAANQIVSGA